MVVQLKKEKRHHWKWNFLWNPSDGRRIPSFIFLGQTCPKSAFLSTFLDGYNTTLSLSFFFPLFLREKSDYETK